MTPLFRRFRFDPIIVRSRLETSGVITSEPKFNEFLPVLESPELPAVGIFYGAYCLSVDYR